jgi:hypothetical protein
MIIADLCLSDIPESARTVGKNGKVYAKVVIDTRKEADQFGNTHTVYMNQTKEEREAKTPKAYIGSAKEIVFNNNNQSQPKGSVNLGF